MGFGTFLKAQTTKNDPSAIEGAKAANYYGYGSGSSNPAKYGPLLPNAQGTGSEFLGSFSTGLGGEGVTDPLRTKYKGKFDYRGPQYMAQFLQGEFAPGGFLAPGQTSLETAGRTRDLFEQGNQDYDRSLNQLGASGLSSRYAKPIAGQVRTQARNEASDMFSSAMGESNRRRFEALMSYVNMASQTQMAQLRDETNYEIAKKGAKAQKQAAFIGAGAEVGAAALLM